MKIPETAAISLLALLLITGCRGKDTDLDGTGTDVTGDDTAGDAALDPTPDPGEDPPHDTVEDPDPDLPADTAEDPTPDVVTDTTEDPATDVVPDTDDDPPLDGPDDPPEDGSTDAPADWPHDTSSACSAAGGFCSGARWMLCPAGHEPISLDHMGCDTNGWCCVAAPSSTCTDSGTANCVPGTACEGCWGDAGGGLICESGRVCCVDMCW